MNNLFYTIGGLWHYPIYWWLCLIRSDNLDGVPYNLLRCMSGALTLLACVLVPILLGVWLK